MPYHADQMIYFMSQFNYIKSVQYPFKPKHAPTSRLNRKGRRVKGKWGSRHTYELEKEGKLNKDSMEEDREKWK